MLSSNQRAPNHKHSSLLHRIALLLFLLGTSAGLHSETLSGKVVDQSGAVIVGARIEISGPALPNPVVLLSDAQGQFSSADLKPGTYSLRVTRDGFEPLVKSVDLHASTELRLELNVARRREEVAVSGKNFAFANLRSLLYQMLRAIGSA